MVSCITHRQNGFSCMLILIKQPPKTKGFLIHDILNDPNLKEQKSITSHYFMKFSHAVDDFYGDIPQNSILREFSADGRFFVFGVTLLQLQVAKIQVAVSNLLWRVGWGSDRSTSRCFKSTSHKFSIEAVFKASEASFNGRRPSERQGREVRKKSL